MASSTSRSPARSAVVVVDVGAVVLVVAAAVPVAAQQRDPELQLRLLPLERPVRQDRVDPAARRDKQDKVVAVDVAPPLREDRKHPSPAWLFLCWMGNRSRPQRLRLRARRQLLGRPLEAAVSS